MEAVERMKMVQKMVVLLVVQMVAVRSMALVAMEIWNRLLFIAGRKTLIHC